MMEGRSQRAEGRRFRQIYFCLLTSAFCLSLAAAPLAEDDFERILMPINIKGEVLGAGGSRWVSEAFIANAGTSAVDARWGACNVLIDPCPPFVSLPPGGRAVAFAPDTTFTIITPGVFIYVAKSALTQVFATARVRDLSRQSDSAGTEIPFVRTSDFQNRVLLLDIPNDDRFRNTLRVYGSGPSPMLARIRIWENTSDGTPLVDVNRSLAGIVSLLPITFPQTPAYVEVPLEPFGLLGRGGALRIQVDADQPLWAFVSTTNNTTQQFTLVTPQISRK